MPIYEYECMSCGKRFEKFQKISDKPLTRCKICNGQLSKLISNCAFHLKGSGWYATDYKKPVDTVGKKSSSGNGADHTEKTETPATTTETKSETKTETKTENTNA